MKKQLIFTAISLIALTACNATDKSQVNQSVEVTNATTVTTETTTEKFETTTEVVQTTTEEVSYPDSNIVEVPESGLAFIFDDNTFVKNNHRIDLYLSIVNTSKTTERFEITDLSMQKGGNVPFDFTYSFWTVIYDDGSQEMFPGYCNLAPGESKTFKVGISDADLRDTTLSGFKLYYKNYEIKDL